MVQKFVRYFVVSILSLFLTNIAIAQDENLIQSPMPQTPSAQPMLTPTPPSLKARAYILMDANSGVILAQKNMHTKYPPASLTKMMTMFIVSKALQAGTIQPDTQVPISKKAWQTGGSKMFIKVGTDVPVKDLVQGIIVDSGNDACVAMAEYLAGGDEVFANMMNTEAQRLGMLNTHYKNCTGLPKEDHYSTAYDLALLARAIIHNYPVDYQRYKQKWFTYNGIRQPNRNRLLWRYAYADGMKTGHTAKAGYCLVASATKNDMRLITVVLGEPSDEARAYDSIKLLNYGFRFFETHLVYKGGQSLATPRIWSGSEKTVQAGLGEDLYVTTPIAQYQRIKVTVQPDADLKAPIDKGGKIGTVVITLDAKPIISKPLIALQEIGKGGMWRRSIDCLSRLMHNWFGSSKDEQPVKAAKEEPKAATDQQPTDQQPNTENTTDQPTPVTE